MSAINDALRRASNSAKTNPGANPAPPPLPSGLDLPPSAPPAAGMRLPASAAGALPPIITVPPGLASSNTEKKPSKAPLVVTLILLFCLAGAGAAYFFGKKYLIAQAREKMQKAAAELTNDARMAALFPNPKVAVPGATNNVSANPAPAGPQAAVSRAPEVAPKPTPVVSPPALVANVVPRAPVSFPPLRLQSIFFRTTNACVMINGKTLFVDDQINGVTVADIQPASVTLVLSGQTNILTLR